MRTIQDKVAVVTGGVSGIGLAIAATFARAGMRVIVTYRRPEHLEEAQRHFREAGGVIHPMKLDVTDRAAVCRFADEAEAVFGRIHVLCNNAGVNLLGPMDEATFDDWDWILGVNLHGVINTVVSLLPRIKRHGEGGHIVNIASMGSFISGPNSGVYTTSKFALRGLSESLRLNLARHGIGVSLVCPGLTQSRIYEAPSHRPPQWRNTAVRLDASQQERLAQVHATGMDASEVAGKVLQAILRRQFYVFTHSEFKAEVRDLYDEVMNAMPDAAAADAPREQYESQRRSAVRAAKRLVLEFESGSDSQ